MDLREKQDIYAKHVMSRIATSYQFTEVKNGPLGTRILKTQGEGVAEFLILYEKVSHPLRLL